VKLDDAAARLEALGNPTRLRIYRALVRAGDDGLTVGTLQAKLDVAPSTISRHVKSLAAVGLITQERRATSLICRARFELMHALVDYLPSAQWPTYGKLWVTKDGSEPHRFSSFALDSGRRWHEQGTLLTAPRLDLRLVGYGDHQYRAQRAASSARSSTETGTSPFSKSALSLSATSLAVITPSGQPAIAIVCEIARNAVCTSVRFCSSEIFGFFDLNPSTANRKSTNDLLNFSSSGRA